MIRNDWTRGEITEIYNTPVLDLIYRAAAVHRQHHDAQEVQVCTLLSVKTGGCPEDCAYCPQAARYHTDVKVHKLMEVDEVMQKAIDAKESGSTRFCMGAAWREVRDNKDFDKVLDMVKGVSTLGMEVCCTLGMLTHEQARKTTKMQGFMHTIITLIRAKNFTAILFLREPIKTGLIHWIMYAKQKFRFVRAASSVWVSKKTTVSECC